MTNQYEKNNMISVWLKWRFYETPVKMFLLMRKHLSFLFFYFSIHTLIMTLFSPWHMYRWAYPKGFDIKIYPQVFISNTFSRLMGAMVRIFLIIFSIFSELALIIIWLFAITVWIFLPLILIASIILIIIF